MSKPKRTPAPKPAHPTDEENRGFWGAVKAKLNRAMDTGETVIGEWRVDTTHPSYDPDRPFDPCELHASHPAVIGRA